MAAVPVILIAVFSFHAGSQGIQRHTKSHLTSVVTVKSQEVERWLRPLEAASSLLAGSATITKDTKLLLRAEPFPEAVAAGADLERHFKNTIQRNAGLRRISLVSPSGTLLLGSTDGSQIHELTLPPPVGLGSPGASVLLPAYLPGDKEQPAIVTAPVKDGKRTVAYAVIEAHTIPLFETLSPDAGLGRNGKIYLVNDSGELLTPFPTYPDQSTVMNLEGAIPESPERSGGGLIYTDVTGEEVVGAYTTIEPMGWRVVAEVPVSEAYGDIRQMRWAIVGASGAFLVLALVVAYLLTRKVTRPLRTLMEGAEIIGRGRLDHRIRVNSKDEIGMLAQSFNTMAKDLKANIDGRLEERRKAEAELEKQNRELEKASQAKSQVLATVSHELKTPLTGIIGYVHVMLGKQDMVGHLNETQERYLDIVRQCSNRLNDLIADLLDVSSIESDGLVLALTDLDIEREVRDAVVSVQEQFHEKNLQVVLDLSPELPVVSGDRLRVSQILGNLVSNAYKYSPEGTSVTVRVVEEGEYVHIDVADQGMGIPQEEQAQLFEKFFRSKEVINRGINGTGLGLFVVKHLVTAHGGRIWLTSEVGKGTTVSFTLPKAVETATNREGLLVRRNVDR